MRKPELEPVIKTDTDTDTPPDIPADTGDSAASGGGHVVSDTNQLRSLVQRKARAAQYSLRPVSSRAERAEISGISVPLFRSVLPFRRGRDRRRH